MFFFDEDDEKAAEAFLLAVYMVCMLMALSNVLKP